MFVHKINCWCPTHYNAAIKKDALAIVVTYIIPKVTYLPLIITDNLSQQRSIIALLLYTTELIG